MENLTMIHDMVTLIIAYNEIEKFKVIYSISHVKNCLGQQTRPILSCCQIGRSK